MIAIALTLFLLLFLPYRLSRGFPALFRIAIVLIVSVKSIFMIALHTRHVRNTGHPIILDASTDAKGYYDFGSTFANQPLASISVDDLIGERGGSAHLGYYVANIIAFKLAPNDPMLLLRLAKLLLFHVALGMLTTLWRRRTTDGRAFFAYLILGLLFYQFFYYSFRNLKDDLLLSLFMMLMAMIDRTLSREVTTDPPLTKNRAIAHWIAIAFIIWIISTIRFYLGATIVIALGAHMLSGPNVRWYTRAALSIIIGGGLVLLMGTPGGEMVQSRGGAGALFDALFNIYGLFKVFVTPLPWQHTNKLLVVAHTFYLLMLAPALLAFILRLRFNINWKLYVLLIVGLVVGGHMNDFGPRKRFVMYPVLMSWIVYAGVRREETDDYPFADAYLDDSTKHPAPLPA